MQLWLFLQVNAFKHGVYYSLSLLEKYKTMNFARRVYLWVSFDYPNNKRKLTYFSSPMVSISRVHLTLLD